jgi:hypothetical protein
MQLGASPGKVAVLGVLALVAAVFLIHNAISGEGQGPATAPAAATPGTTAEFGGEAGAVSEPLAKRAALRSGRRKTVQNDNGTLRLRPIDARKGNIDPTLRLDLLARLQSLPFAPSGRSLFEAGPAPMAPGAGPTKQVVTIDPGPKPPPIAANLAPSAPPMPLKFYGFVQPRGVAGPNRGFFMNGDNILVAAEGELLVKRYKVLQLTAKSAVMEDTVSHRRETLTLVPEAQNAM